ncbi:MAG: Pseudouridine synthase [Candidatus Saccharibacteria bacterium]|nr:Pseudouridine synthase [Candidatus Saccharibacteria bacterium]
MSDLELSRAERLDQRVVSQFPELSRMYATKLVEDGNVTVNGKVITKGGHKLWETDVVKVDYNPEEAAAIPDIELPILYEDDDCVVINKPLGLLTHSKGVFNPEATVATWLSSRLKGLAGDRDGIVHRLDRATSGVMICAKNPEALSALQKQFSQRRTKKTYVAIVRGRLKAPEAVIDMPIERNPKKPQTFRVGSNGKPATTAYKVLKTTEHYSLVELKPFTGRTHQLRVHLEELGHPIVGDVLYDGPVADRLFLHARELEITIPSRERKVFETPVPSSFEEFLSRDR